MEDVVEIFGKRLKVVQDMDDSAYFCNECSLKYVCFNVIGNTGIICKDTEGKMNRHFEEVID